MIDIAPPPSELTAREIREVRQWAVARVLVLLPAPANSLPGGDRLLWLDLASVKSVAASAEALAQYVLSPTTDAPADIAKPDEDLLSEIKALLGSPLMANRGGGRPIPVNDLIFAAALRQGATPVAAGGNDSRNRIMTATARRTLRTSLFAEVDVTDLVHDIHLIGGNSGLDEVRINRICQLAEREWIAQQRQDVVQPAAGTPA